ncbi:hypothetical protein QBC33DRAFT_527272 [Phialemonium atrogriseum]|uniref:Uncharacterized protein n=1 Tax=Phialemonium atrogriseum TaxID=1093897 RepID=A0AAJ0FQG7_9PEZI|nr:uncharacterized protein QBC33DRAFT_527272 [Phialemonium atrogriseum]KAK1771224.1 hypothetical protein QBC33DRAFT_527272 [Phialemonium atrogriseum]
MGFRWVMGGHNCYIVSLCLESLCQALWCGGHWSHRLLFEKHSKGYEKCKTDMIKKHLCRLELGEGEIIGIGKGKGG